MTRTALAVSDRKVAVARIRIAAVCRGSNLDLVGAAGFDRRRNLPTLLAIVFGSSLDGLVGFTGFEQFDFYEGASIPLIPLAGVFFSGCPLLTAIRRCDFESASRPNRAGNKT